MQAINPANISLPLSRSNSSSSVSSTASNVSGTTKVTSASEGSDKAAKKAPQVDEILNDSRFLRTSMTTIKNPAVDAEKVLGETAGLRTQMATSKKTLLSSAQGVVKSLINGVKYLGSLIGAAVGAVKNFLSNLFTSKAAKAEAAVYAAELLPDFTEQDFKETYSLSATGATKRDLAAGKLRDVEADAKPISVGAEQFGTMSALKMVGAPNVASAPAVFVTDHAKKVAMLNELDLQQEIAAWHQS